MMIILKIQNKNIMKIVYQKTVTGLEITMLQKYTRLPLIKFINGTTHEIYPVALTNDFKIKVL